MDYVDVSVQYVLQTTKTPIFALVLRRWKTEKMRSQHDDEEYEAFQKSLLQWVVRPTSKVCQKMIGKEYRPVSSNSRKLAIK